MKKKEKPNFTGKAKILEMKASGFAEHNSGLHIVDHLVPLVKKILPDSQIAQSTELGRCRCTSIVKNVIVETQVQKTINDLENSHFSILFDESAAKEKY